MEEITEVIEPTTEPIVEVRKPKQIPTKSPGESYEGAYIWHSQ